MGIKINSSIPEDKLLLKRSFESFTTTNSYIMIKQRLSAILAGSRSLSLINRDAQIVKQDLPRVPASHTPPILLSYFSVMTHGVLPKSYEHLMSIPACEWCSQCLPTDQC